jgi:hypothetical protein
MAAPSVGADTEVGAARAENQEILQVPSEEKRCVRPAQELLLVAADRLTGKRKRIERRT